MRRLKLFILIWFPLAWASDTLLSPTGINYEVAALMSVKSKLRDEHHVLVGWDINSVDPCTWSLVVCSSEGFVVSLEMTSKGLSGELSPSVGNLSRLQTMLLQNNGISGNVPAELGNLQELQTLDLSHNQFVGQIPSSLGYLTHLRYLRLSGNNLSGPIPRSVANLRNLLLLDLSSNNLSGPSLKIRAKEYSVAGNTFLCASSHLLGCVSVPRPLESTGLPRKASNHHVVVVAVSISCAFMASVMLVFLFLHFWRWHFPFGYYEQQNSNFDMGNLKRFSFRELQVATDNFSPKNTLGQGGYGVVYKGQLRDGTVIAIKRLKDPIFTGQLQFQTEVEMISLALHRNILRLYGFCMTSSERLLVYPYMSNGSVADCLRDPCREKPSLDWSRRMTIAVGAARGLLYLHEQCCPKIIHRDVKAANVLLDDDFEAVVGDFGLAKLLDRRDSHVTTAVRGTVGHIAPEYLSTGQSSEKTDVYGFGIFLLELITGLRPGHGFNGQTQTLIPEYVRTLEKERRLSQMVDRNLAGYFNPSELEKVVSMALCCTESHPSHRPKMHEVVNLLEGVLVPAECVEDISEATLSGRKYNIPRDCNEPLDESSIIEAMELSGPR